MSRITCFLTLAMLSLGYGQLKREEKPTYRPDDGGGEYEALLDLALPVELGELYFQLADRYKWVFVVRVTSSVTEEKLYVVRKPWHGTVEASVVQPLESIVKQWDDHWEREPSLTVEEAAKRVKTTRREYGVDTCPSLVSIAQKLEEAKIPAIPNIGLTLPATYYKILAAKWLSRLRIDYYGPGSNARSQPNDLLEAVEGLRRTIQECSQK